MNKKLLRQLIRENKMMDAGLVTPARVTEVIFDARGKPVFEERDPRAWQRKQAESHAVDVLRARRKLNLTQDEFSSLLGVSRRTVENWEQGRRSPAGAARVLIGVAEKYPEVVLASA